MMAHCPDIERELAAYCSDELDAPVRQAVSAHLDVCPSCRNELARELELRYTMRSLPTPRAPLDLGNGIRLAIRRQEPPASRFGRRLAAAGTLAAAALAVVLLLPGSHPESGSGGAYSDQEIAAARQEVAYTLSLTARVLDRTRKSAVIEVFGDKLPQAINESFKTMKPSTPGGNG